MCLDISQKIRNEDCKCDSPRGYHPLKTSGNSPSRSVRHTPKYCHSDQRPIHKKKCHSERSRGTCSFASVSTKKGCLILSRLLRKGGNHETQRTLVILTLNEMSREISFSRSPPLNGEKQYNHRGIDTMRLLKSLPSLVACLLFS